MFESISSKNVSSNNSNFNDPRDYAGGLNEVVKQQAKKFIEINGLPEDASIAEDDGTVLITWDGKSLEYFQKNYQALFHLSWKGHPVSVTAQVRQNSNWEIIVVFKSAGDHYFAETYPCDQLGLRVSHPYSGSTKTQSLPSIFDLSANPLDQNTKDQRLMDSIRSGDFDNVVNLVKAGANINKIVVDGNNQKNNPITLSTKYPKILNYLLESGADVRATLNQKQTALHYLVKELNGNFDKSLTIQESFRLLLQKGADINAPDLYGKTPLHFAVTSSKAAMFLIENGADYQIKDHDGWKFLHRAYQFCRLDILKYLVDKGCSLNEFSPDGFNALHYACGMTYGSSIDEKLTLIRYLVDGLKMNVNIHSKWHDGKDGSVTPLMMAVNAQEHFEDDFRILEFLVSKGGNLNDEIFLVLNGKKHSVAKVLDWARNSVGVPYYVSQWLVTHGAK
jgi:hypothetical protein